MFCIVAKNNNNNKTKNRNRIATWKRVKNEGSGEEARGQMFKER